MLMLPFANANEVPNMVAFCRTRSKFNMRHTQVVSLHKLDSHQELGIVISALE